MNKKRVSHLLVAQVLGPFWSPADEEYVRLMQIDLNNESQLIDLLEEYIAPYVDDYDEESQELIKDTLSYYIKSESLNLELVFDGFNIPFEAPKDVSSFLKTLWAVLFGETSIRENSLSDYVVNDSEEVANALYRKGYR